MALSAQHDVFAPEARPDHRGAVARLSAIHAEAVEVTQLAGLLGRSVQLTIVIALLTGAAVAFEDATESLSIAWCAAMLLGTTAFVLIFSRAVDRPFDRDALRKFAGELDATLVLTGLAWGAGGFLILPGDANLYFLALFAATPGLAAASLLRDFKPTMLFLAPSAVLTAFACLLRAENVIASAFVLTTCGLLASISYLTLRRRSKFRDPALP